MNPVDHPHGVSTFIQVYNDFADMICRVVTINISEKQAQSLVMPFKVKKPVSLLLGELVCFVVRRRSRIEGWIEGISYTSDTLALHLCTLGMEHSDDEIKIPDMKLLVDIYPRICDNHLCIYSVN